MNTSTFKEVFTASIKVFTLLWHYFVLFICWLLVSALFKVYGWINFSLLFQYLVERIHTNYALQVRTAHILFLSNEIMMECLLLRTPWRLRLPHWTCSDICDCFISLVRLSQTHFWPTQTHQLHLLQSLSDFYWTDWMRWEVRYYFLEAKLVKKVLLVFFFFSNNLCVILVSHA